MDAFPLAFHYSPGSHSLLSPNASYQATPAKPASKYSLAFPDRGQGRGRGGSGALEYVPKAVSQPQRHNRPIPSGKYVVDSSRPPTDLEYDPRSSYSSRHPSRARYRDKRPEKRPWGPCGSEPYMPAPQEAL
ncbi:RNA exonuclease 1 [Saguinus oedipus]|uniref:RNA exonuclease 1 n=1 Tax=Saguinus oedipus TaxID=9490 RepID=A0ABQ9UTQ4_SAGOE|nr:RNA exonuclease 1 [Saguinus oedipus]